MAVVTTASTSVFNVYATPAIINDNRDIKANVFAASETVEVAAADDNNSIYLFVPIKSADRLIDLYVMNDAITGGTSYDFGLFTFDGTTATEIDVDVYASAVDLSSARGPTSIGFEARNIANIKQRVWQNAGLTEDSGLTYYIGAKANTVGTAAGTISVTALIGSA